MESMYLCYIHRYSSLLPRSESLKGVYILLHFFRFLHIFSYAFSCNPTARLDSSFRTLKLYYKSIIADISNRLYHFIREFLPRNLLQRIGINNAEMYIREFCNWLNFNRNFIENHSIFQASI